LLSPVGIWVDVQDLGGESGDLLVINTERALDLVASGEILEEVGNARGNVGWDIGSQAAKDRVE
jgi:hypothetical protein